MLTMALDYPNDFGRDIAHLRLSIQGIQPPGFERVDEAVGWLGAMQSQEYAQAKWSIGLRVTDCDESAVDTALAEGSVLRTHVLRPTWHYVRPEDIRWMQQATSHRVRSMLASYDRALELDEELYVRATEVIERSVEGERHRTRPELAEALAAAGIAAKGQLLGHIVMRAELDAVLCSGIPRGKQVTYALVAERAPGAKRLGREEALAELTHRYFRSHGPATEKDFRWWASLTAVEARRGLQMVAPQLESGEHEGRIYWWAEGSAVWPTREAGVAHLMQAYDEFVVGYSESRGALDVDRAAGAVPGGTPLYHVIILDGQAVGRWRRQPRSKDVKYQIQLMRPLTSWQRESVYQAVHRHAAFSGVAAEVEES